MRPALGRVDVQGALDPGQPALQTGKPVTLGQARTTHAVVGDDGLDHAAGLAQVDLHAGGAGVLGRVRERLAHREVQGALDLDPGAPGEVVVDGDRHRVRPGEALDRRAEPAVDEQRRGDPPAQAAQLTERLAGRQAGVGEDRLRLLRVGGEEPLGAGQVELHAHETLLGAVVQVPLETS